MQFHLSIRLCNIIPKGFSIFVKNRVLNVNRIFEIKIFRVFVQLLVQTRSSTCSIIKQIVLFSYQKYRAASPRVDSNLIGNKTSLSFCATGSVTV